MAKLSYRDDPGFFRAYRASIDPISPELFKSLTELLSRKVTSGPHIIEIGEIDGPTKLSDGRPLDARLIDPDVKRNPETSLGIIGLIGIGWQAVEADGIDNLWVISKADSLGWVTDYDSGRPATDFEIAQIINDLSDGL